jgi:hypothetical protein
LARESLIGWPRYKKRRDDRGEGGEWAKQIFGRRRCQWAYNNYFYYYLPNLLFLGPSSAHRRGGAKKTFTTFQFLKIFHVGFLSPTKKKKRKKEKWYNLKRRSNIFFLAVFHSPLD